MKKSELTKKLDEIAQKRSILRDEAIALKQQYIDSLPFKVGDKVEVTQHSKTVLGPVYVSQIQYTYQLEVKFTKPKKDGSMGGQSAGIYWADKIRVLETGVEFDLTAKD